MSEVEQNTLWVVLLNMPARTAKVGVMEDDQDHIIIPKGDIIEFRYRYGVHFRTVDNVYAFVEQDTLYKHCDLYGRILKKVAWENEKTLREILDEGLYIGC